MNVEKIKITDSINEFPLCKTHKRVYFGNEFCERKLFSVDDLQYIVKNFCNKKITLVYPYLSESSLKTALKTAEFAYKNNNIFDEIVFNDWGFFYSIKKQFKSFNFILGRLLTKQKTDPFAKEIIFNTQKITATKENIFIPKKVSEYTKKYFENTLVNSKIFHNFMVDNNITRVELDNVNWDMDIKLPETVKADIFYPYVKITTTKFCGYLNMSAEKCGNYCKMRSIKLEKYRSKYNYVIKGNTVFYKNTVIPCIKKLVSNSIDRIILND